MDNPLIPMPPYGRSDVPVFDPRYDSGNPRDIRPGESQSDYMARLGAMNAAGAGNSLAAAPPVSKGGGISVEQAAAIVKGPESGGRYNVGYGEADLSSAPLDEYGFPIWSGKMGSAGISHAAGAYQFEPGTWRKYAVKAGVKDFSPESQDAVFREAYLDQGFKPWAPYNSKIRSILAGMGQIRNQAGGLEPVGSVVAGVLPGANPGANAGLSGKINMGPLTLPDAIGDAKEKVAEALKGQDNQAGGNLSSSLSLLALLGRYKITPITYDPWKYVPKVTLDPFEV